MKITQRQLQLALDTMTAREQRYKRAIAKIRHWALDGFVSQFVFDGKKTHRQWLFEQELSRS